MEVARQKIQRCTRTERRLQYSMHWRCAVKDGLRSHLFVPAFPGLGRNADAPPLSAWLSCRQVPEQVCNVKTSPVSSVRVVRA